MKKMDMAVIGIGTIGKNLCDAISRIEKWPGDIKIDKCYMISRDRKKLKALAEGLNNSTKATEFYGVAVYDLIEVYEKRIPLTLICLDSYKNIDKSNREIVCKNNIDEINSLAQTFKRINEGLTTDFCIGIVTNEPTRLAAVFANTSKIDPYRIFGITHVDTLRQRYLIKKTIGELKDFKDLETHFFCIGGHLPEEMIPAYDIGIEDVSKDHFDRLRKEYDNLKREVRVFGETQMNVLKDTSTDSIDAIIETIEAVVGEKRYVSAAVFCDFDSSFFREDPAVKSGRIAINKELICHPSYNVLPTGWSSLKTNFKAGADEEEDRIKKWFWNVEEKVKKEFYNVVKKHISFAKENKIFLFVIDKKPLSTPVQISGNIGFYYSLDNLLQHSDSKIKRELDKVILKIGRVRGKDEYLYAITDDKVFIFDENLQLVNEYNVKDANSVCFFHNDYFIASNEGLFCRDEVRCKIKAQDVIPTTDGPIFINENQIVDCNSKTLFLWTHSLSSLRETSKHICTLDIYGDLLFLEKDESNKNYVLNKMIEGKKISAMEVYGTYDKFIIAKTKDGFIKIDSDFKIEEDNTVKATDNIIAFKKNFLFVDTRKSIVTDGRDYYKIIPGIKSICL